MRRTILLLAAAALAITPAAAQRLRYLVLKMSPRRSVTIPNLCGARRRRDRSTRGLCRVLGRRVGAFSGVANAGQTLHFTTLNSAVENAFSVPGGYVYITRQLMGLMDDELQLAFALGHEVGHVAANHAHIREQYAQRNPLGVFGSIIGAIFGSGITDVLSARARLDMLSFSRDQEYEADTLGLRYMAAAGYDPAGAAGILGALSRQSALQARVQGRTNRQTPEWASTHPLSENRMQRALAAAQQSGRLGAGVRNRDIFLSEIEGIYVDDDPAQGVIEGRPSRIRT